MQVLLLGATGVIGQLLIPDLLEAGHTLTLYARSPQNLPKAVRSDQRVTIVRGELLDSDALLRALDGVDAVVSALGPDLFPPPGNPISKTYSIIMGHMRTLGIKRIIALGTVSIPDSNDQRDIPLWLSKQLMRILSPRYLAEILAIGDVVRSEGADLDWTIVRCPWLTNGTTGQYQAGYKGDGKRRISLERAGYAAFIMDELRDRKWVKKAPMISLSTKTHTD